MGPGETIGLIAVVFLAVVIVAAFFATYSRRLQFKQRQLELQAERGSNVGGVATSETIARLEKRVRVLERLATDRGQDVAAQIEALRGDRQEHASTDQTASGVTAR